MEVVRTSGCSMMSNIEDKGAVAGSTAKVPRYCRVFFVSIRIIKPLLSPGGDIFATQNFHDVSDEMQVTLFLRPSLSGATRV